MEVRTVNLNWNDEVITWVPVAHGVPAVQEEKLVLNDCGELFFAVMDEDEDWFDASTGLPLDGIVCWAESKPEGPEIDESEWPDVGEEIEPQMDADARGCSGEVR